ncbi:hypothetical protein ACS0PU_008190 [Formica fusca]
MCPRKNTRSGSRVTVRWIKNMPDKIADIVKIKVEDKSSYRCVICGNIYPRRFNAERHYKRFHETTQARRCCDETFYTKSDYYDHKKNMHNERKRYGRGWKEETQSSDSSTECNINKHGDCVLDVTPKTSISVGIVKERISEKCADANSAHHAQDNAKDAESDNKEKSKNNMWHPRQSAKSPKKIFIYRMQQETNGSQNSAPLRSIENFTGKSLNKTTTKKNAFQNAVKVSSDADKENVIIYDCTATSVPDLMRLMRSTIDF